MRQFFGVVLGGCRIRVRRPSSQGPEDRRGRRGLCGPHHDLWLPGNSTYNGALVQAVEYTGEATTLSWELQHGLCAAAGRATPGSSTTEPLWLDKFCAYSASDNHVVAEICEWNHQEFTHISGSLSGGVGYMCAGYDCNVQVRVEGTTAADHSNYRYSTTNPYGTHRVTINNGDAISMGRSEFTMMAPKAQPVRV